MRKRAPDYQRELGQRQEARILASLSESPKGLKQLAEVMSFTPSNTGIYIRRLRKADKIHIVGYEKQNGRPAPFWAAGTGIDAEYTPRRFPSPIQSSEDRKTRILELLVKARTVAEIASLMHLSKNRVQFYIHELRLAQKVYVKAWRHPGKRGDWAPVYARGVVPDALKPKETRADRHKREKANVDGYERTKAKRRARWNVKVATKKRQGIFAALGI